MSTSSSKIYPLLIKLALLITISFFISLLICSYVSVIFVRDNSNLNQKNSPSVFFTKLSDTTSFGVLQKNIMSRNIFNVSGEIPFEDTPEGSQNMMAKNFDKVACSFNASMVPVELLGIIYTGNSATNLVTLKMPNAPIADVYHEGQAITGHETYSVYKITSPLEVQLRQNNKKICLSLGSKDDSAKSNVPHKKMSTPVETIQLTMDYVTKELGPGFSKVLTTARFTPEITNNKPVGFKVFAILKGSLFDKIKLQDGDIIAKINDVNLDDPTQGFVLYEAFQNENEVTLDIVRNGAEMIKKVLIQ